MSLGAPRRLRADGSRGPARSCGGIWPTPVRPTVASLASRYGLDAESVRSALVGLGRDVASGRFTPEGGEQWIDRLNLEQMHRRSLSILPPGSARRSRSPDTRRFSSAIRASATGA